MNNFEKKYQTFFDEFKKLPLEEKEFLVNKVNKIMNTTEFSSKHCYNTFKNLLNLAEHNDFKFNDKKIMEIGSGKYSIFTALLWLSQNVQSFTAIDKYCEPFISPYWKKIYADQFEDYCIRSNSILNLLNTDNWGKIEKQMSIYVGDYTELDLPTGYFDFVYSMAVFEHIENPALTVKKMFDSMAPGSISYHNIDLRPHEGDKLSPFTILKYSSDEWKRKKTNNNSWIYLNRLRSSDWINLFEETGFKILRIQTSNFQNTVTEKEKASFNQEFWSYSIETLNHSILNITLRK